MCQSTNPPRRQARKVAPLIAQPLLCGARADHPHALPPCSELDRRPKCSQSCSYQHRSHRVGQQFGSRSHIAVRRQDHPHGFHSRHECPHQVPPLQECSHSDQLPLHFPLSRVWSKSILVWLRYRKPKLILVQGDAGSVARPKHATKTQHQYLRRWYEPRRVVPQNWHGA